MSANQDQEALAAVISVCGDLFSATGVSAADNFFMLGGTSLNAIELTEELLARYQLELSLEPVFTCETLHELALHCKPSAADRSAPPS